MAAAKVDLLKEAEAGGFRKDLYYRLNVAKIPIPPLRERRDDIPLLFLHFVQKACQRFNRPIPEVPEVHFANLMARPWAGNVRELSNAAERYVLGLSDMQVANGTTGAENMPALSLDERMDAYERQVISVALRKNAGRITRTAESLGIPRKKLYLRMRRLDLRKEDYTQTDPTP